MRWSVVFVAGLAACSGSVDAPALIDAQTDTDVSPRAGDDGPAPGDMGPGDMGPGDGAPGDAAGDGPGGSDGDSAAGDPVPDTNPCTNGTAVFCDDFEAATAGGAPKAPWQVSTFKGTVSVSSAQAYSGSKALRCTTQASNTDSNKFRQALINVTTQDAPITNNNFFGRMMVWFGRVPPATSLHWSNVRASGTVKTETFNGAPFTASYNYGGQVSHLMANYNSGDGPQSDCWLHSDTIVPATTWECFEWQFDGPNQTMRFWLNGALLDKLTMVDQGQGCINHDLGDRWVAPEFDTIAIGWEHYQDIDYDVEFYVDDVAFGPTRLGCPPAY